MPYTYIIHKEKQTYEEWDFKTQREEQMATREKNIWILMVFILSGLVIGGLLGQLASGIDFLWWLSYGEEFGLTTPLVLDLSIIKLTFGLQLKINIASIIGVAIAIFIYRKV
jgi:hypothetical protein